LLGVLAVIVLVASAVGCGIVSDQTKQEAKKKLEATVKQTKQDVKQKVEAKKQQVKKKVLGLTPENGQTTVSNVGSDEGSQKGARTNTTLYTRVQGGGRPASPLLPRKEHRPDSLGTGDLG
jgi:phosphopantetheine adenylyltransferase